MNNLKVKRILSEEEIEKKLDRMAVEIAEHNLYSDKIALVGIVRRGVPLAERLAKRLKHLTRAEIFVGSLDITLYGADHNLIDKLPVLNDTNIPFSLKDMPVILVDDILYTGKTVIKAINVLQNIDEISELQLAVFLDRGRRSFPIGADYVGMTVQSSRLERVVLHINEVDGTDEVIIEKRG